MQSFIKPTNASLTNQLAAIDSDDSNPDKKVEIDYAIIENLCVLATPTVNSGPVDNMQINSLITAGYDAEHIIQSIKRLESSLLNAGVDPIALIQITQTFSQNPSSPARTSIIYNIIRELAEKYPNPTDFKHALHDMSINFKKIVEDVLADLFITQLFLEPDVNPFKIHVNQHSICGHGAQINPDDCSKYKGFGAISDGILAYASIDRNVALILKIRVAYVKAIAEYQAEESSDKQKVVDLASRIHRFDTLLNQICKDRFRLQECDEVIKDGAPDAMVKHQPNAVMPIKEADAAPNNSEFMPRGIGRIPMHIPKQPLTEPQRIVLAAVYIRLFNMLADDPFFQSGGGYHNSVGRASDAIFQLADKSNDYVLLQMLFNAASNSAKVKGDWQSSKGEHRDDYWKRRVTSMTPTFNAAIRRVQGYLPTEKKSTDVVVPEQAPTTRRFTFT